MAASSGRFRLRWRAPRGSGLLVVRVRAVWRGAAAVSVPARVAVSPTRVLSAARVLSAPAPGRAGVLRVDGDTALRVGEFVALDVGPRTPLGLLARVAGVRRSGSGTALEVRPARIDEAVPAGHIGSGGLHAAAAGSTPRDFHPPLSCSGGVAGALAGSLSVRLDPSFELEWAPAGIRRAAAAVTLNGDAVLSASVGAAAACSLDETGVATWDAPALRFFAGPIPVVVVPRTTLYVSATAQAGGAVATGLHGTLGATAGLRYDGAVHSTGSFEPRLSATPPKSRVTASLAATLTPSVTFLVYGQAGPRFDLATGLQLEAVAGGDPWWTLSAPVALSAGLSVPAVSDLDVPQRTVFSRSFPLAQAAPGSAQQVPATVPSAPGAATPAGPVRERARITWTSGGSDVDLHVWDEHGNHAWFGNPDAIPGGSLSGDDTDGFGPEVFSAPAGEPLTYGLCYFDDHGTGPARVAARVVSADGSARDSTHLLGQNRDHVLLEAGPFSPPEGWCDG